MSKETTELINQVLGEETPGKIINKNFTTGKEIYEECEKYERLIAEEGREAFLDRVREILKKTRNTDVSGPKTEA